MRLITLFVNLDNSYHKNTEHNCNCNIIFRTKQVIFDEGDAEARRKERARLISFVESCQGNSVPVVLEVVLVEAAVVLVVDAAVVVVVVVVG